VIFPPEALINNDFAKISRFNLIPRRPGGCPDQTEMAQTAPAEGRLRRREVGVLINIWKHEKKLSRIGFDAQQGGAERRPGLSCPIAGRMLAVPRLRRLAPAGAEARVEGRNSPDDAAKEGS
jgi:hypothetical protein